MVLEIVSLADLLQEVDESTISKILADFKTIPDFRTGDTHDVEKFLNDNAIQFQKMGLAATHLIYSSYKDKNILVGYFAIANKHLVLNSKVFNKLSNNYKKRFQKIGYRLHIQNGKNNRAVLVVPSFLIGQLGLNYSEEARNTGSLNGYNLMALAEEVIDQAVSTINGKYIWLECQPHEKLLNFYEKCGYTQVVDYKDQNNGLCVFVKKI